MNDSNLAIVDVDGFQLYRKQQRLKSQELDIHPLPLPCKPLTGWELLDTSNYKEKQIPILTHGISK